MQNQSFRTGKDSLGEVNIPATAYYGAQTQRAVENFPISGLRLPRSFIRAQAIIKVAAAKANTQLGMLDATIGDAIIQAGEEVIAGRWDEHFVVDVYQAGAGTSQNMNANEIMANRAAELLGQRLDHGIVHPNDHVNMAQSTNDTIHVAINIAAAEQIVHKLLPALSGLEQGLRLKAEEFMPIIKSGRTHLQDAVPIRLGQEFSGYADSVLGAYNHLESASRALFEIGLGGNAVGTGINAHPDYAQTAIEQISAMTGLPFRQPINRFTFMQNTNAAIHCMASLKELAIHIIKITGDLRLLSSGPRTGLAEIQLPAVQPGSSIMPGKVNPVMLEMMYMVCAQVIGNETTVATAALGSQLEINVMMPVIAYNVLTSIDFLANAVAVLDAKCIRGITANKEQCHSWMEASLSLVTALNPIIGYDRAAQLAKQAFAENKTLKQVLREAGLFTPQIEQALDPQRMV